MGKLADKLNAIFGKVDNTEQRYQSSLEKKEEALLVLQIELQEQKQAITELHKMKILGDITEAHFDEKNEKFLLLQKKYDEAQKEIQLIQQYKVEDVTALLEELKATQKEHQASHHDEIRQMQLELLQAKAEYLQKMKLMKERYDNTVRPHNKIQKLEMKLGLIQHAYASTSHEALNNIRVGEASYVNLQVNAPEIFKALYSGEIDHRLQKIITEGLPE